MRNAMYVVGNRICCILILFLIFITPLSLAAASFGDDEKKIVALLNDSMPHKARIVNAISPIGLQGDKYFAYFETLEATGKGDKAYRIVIFNLRQNAIEYAGKWFFIGDYYSDGEGIQGSWEDPKYSIDSFYNVRKKNIDEIIARYGIERGTNLALKLPHSVDGFLISSKAQILNRKSIDGLREDSNYCVSIKIDNREISMTIAEHSVEAIINIKPIGCIEIPGKIGGIIILVATERRGFEGDDFISFLPVSFLFDKK
jgi:hypothetical protein